ncbi:MAG: nitrite/sulfite reductase [Clostridiales bacterium]|nr:nitrite/sulfite reductase [Clostridiales bacterium]
MTQENRYDAPTLPGTYWERDAEHVVVRAHLAAGRMSVSQWHTLRQILDDYPALDLRITTRQNARIYGADKALAEKLLSRLTEAGFQPVGKKGDIVINWDSGLRSDEVFDIYPYALAISDWQSSGLGRAAQVPGKLKTSMTSSPDALETVSYADLGFIAKRNDKGEPGFAVVGGGSLGAMPRLSAQLLDFIPAGDILRAMEAYAQVFIDLFAESKVGKKRMRFAIRKMGEEAFVAAFHKAYDDVKAKNLTGLPQNALRKRDWGEGIDASHPNLRATRFEGIYSLYLPIPAGIVPNEFVAALDDFVNYLEYRPELALAADQAVVVRDLAGDDALALLDALAPLMEKFGIGAAQSHIACVGADLCRFGLAHNSALSAVLRRFNAEDLPEIGISGCMNSCSGHQVKPLGFWGKKSDHNDFANDVYEVVIGGSACRDAAGAIIGENIGSLSVKNVEAFLTDLIAQQKDSGEPWEQFVVNHADALKALVETYKA